MIAVVHGNFMEQLEGYESKYDGKHVNEIAVYSDGEIVRISGIDGSGFQRFEEVDLKCKISSGKYGLYVRYVGF